MSLQLIILLIVRAELPDSEQSELRSLLEKIGGVVSKMAPENIIMITQAGSYIYNLSMPSSDVDYIVVYKEPTEVYG